MKKPNTSAAISLRGMLDQTSICFLFAFLFILSAFVLINLYSSNTVNIVANCIIGLVTIFTFAIFLIVMMQKQVRSSSFCPSTVEITTATGSAKLENLPDRVYSGEMIKLIRFFLVGYDSDLCPDGEIEGNTPDGPIKSYSEDEKILFKKNHLSEIKEKKEKASRLLEAADAISCEAS